MTRIHPRVHAGLAEVCARIQASMSDVVRGLLDQWLRDQGVLRGEVENVDDVAARPVVMVNRVLCSKIDGSATALGQMLVDPDEVAGVQSLGVCRLGGGEVPATGVVLKDGGSFVTLTDPAIVIRLLGSDRFEVEARSRGGGGVKRIEASSANEVLSVN